MIMAKTLTYEVEITRDGGDPVVYYESARWAWQQLATALSIHCDDLERLLPVLRLAWFQQLAEEGEAHQGIRNLFSIHAKLPGIDDPPRRCEFCNDGRAVPGDVSCPTCIASERAACEAGGS